MNKFLFILIVLRLIESFEDLNSYHLIVQIFRLADVIEMKGEVRDNSMKK